MSQIMFNYPAMMGHAEGMHGGAAQLATAAAAVSAEQSALQAGWQGDTGTTYQAWQTQWNSTTEELINAYRAMSDAYQQGTGQMLARDAAEGAKWA
ncbi:WXG100 family type VII secretion target [Mycobacterium sp. DBP42]|uniref:WXG100 family type VII secretion target n=1 Tax=Mycobacteriaceae TaxID=1762 RepID=UPI00110CADA9|nr:WXG100 family type VII secretion target [Mycobacterium sp. DBP42]TMS50684.1 WXG100 family type VII secretion target [Mycobacterium sp. DBP42]